MLTYSDIYGINVFKIFIWGGGGGTSSAKRSEI